MLLPAERRRLLGAFVRSRREAHPPPAEGRRRTPGLRREEVAQRCGISTAWYSWLEQGRDIALSPQALGRLAEALRLTAAERAYLFDLALQRDNFAEIEELGVAGGVERLGGAGHLVGRAGEGHVGAAVVGDVLDDHVDVHARLGQRPEDRRGDAGAVGDAKERHLGLVARERDAAYHFAFHDFLLVADDRSGLVAEAREHL